MNSDYLIVITTTDTKADADKLADVIVGKRLAACAQVEGPIESTYWWQEKLEKGQEWKCSFKTSAAFYHDLETELIDHHPYETPEILAIPIASGSNDYLVWMESELGKTET